MARRGLALLTVAFGLQMTFLGGAAPRRVLLGLGLAQTQAAAEAAWAASTAPSKWAGRWADPDAPGCRREIVMSFDGTKGRLMGAESTGINPGLTAAELSRAKSEPKVGCSKGDTLKFWEAKLSSDGKEGTRESLGNSVINGKQDKHYYKPIC